MSQINGSVVKAFQILSLFSSDRREISAATLAERMGFNAVTSHRFLRTLEATGALVSTGKGSYELGYLLADLGAQVSDTDNLSNIVQPVLETLTRRVGEGSMATLFDGEFAICIAKAVPDRPLFVDVRKGSRLEAYCTAHGKLWLADLPPAQLERYMATVKLDPVSSATGTSREQLLAELDTVRRDGVSFNRAEREVDIHAIAVPVMSRGERMGCGLSAFGSAARFSEKLMAGFRRPLEDAAATIAKRLYGEFDENAGQARSVKQTNNPDGRI